MIDDDWPEKAVRMIASMLVAAAQKQIAKVEEERDRALQRLHDVTHGAAAVDRHRMSEALVAAEERGRLLGEWADVVGRTEDLAALLDSLAEKDDPVGALKREAMRQRQMAATIRARPPRPAFFADDDELRELKRCEGDAAIKALRYREAHALDAADEVAEERRLYKLWVAAASRRHSREVALEEKEANG